MAYKTKDLETTALTAIKKNDLVFIEEVISYLPCSKQTFYDHDLDKLDSIKDALEKNKVSIKAGLRKHWKKTDASPALQIALYKLIGTEAESDRINSQKSTLDINHDFKKGLKIGFDDDDS
jgi:hypothetical protein